MSLVYMKCSVSYAINKKIWIFELSKKQKNNNQTHPKLPVRITAAYMDTIQINHTEFGLEAFFAE